MSTRFLAIVVICTLAGCSNTKASGASRDGGTGDAYIEEAAPDAVLLTDDSLAGGGDDLAQGDASVYVQTDAFAGWMGGSCALNSDCVNSPAALAVAAAKCLDEVFCLSGICRGECTHSCVVVRSDIDPCPTPRLCVKIPAGAGLSLCKITPVPCTVPSDCPAVRPVLPDGGQAAWTCEDGVCRYPGFEYATR
jgi:hypothetical protein